MDSMSNLLEISLGRVGGVFYGMDWFGSEEYLRCEKLEVEFMIY